MVMMTRGSGTGPAGDGGRLSTSSRRGSRQPSRGAIRLTARIVPDGHFRRGVNSREPPSLNTLSNRSHHSGIPDNN